MELLLVLLIAAAYGVNNSYGLLAAACRFTTLFHSRRESPKKSILRNLTHHIAISREHIGPREVAQILSSLNDRNIVFSRLLEFVHYFLHRLLGVDNVIGKDGKILDGLVVVTLIEKDRTHIVKQHMATEKAFLINHGEDIALRRRHQGQQIAESAIWVDRAEIGLNQLIDRHHIENTLVLIMCYLNAFFGNGIGVDGMVEEQPIDDIGQSRDNHQGHDEGITISDFGNEEDARQRRMEHTRHQATHADEGKLCRV